MMYYREINFKDRQPKMSANNYFYYSHSGAFLFGEYNGYVGSMENHLSEYPDHKLVWLEPESEYDPDSYYKRK